MKPSTRRAIRWVLASAAFVAAATVLFEAVGQSSPRPPRTVLNGYQPVRTDDSGVLTALNFALADQKRKNRTSAKLLSVVSAERQVSTGENFRLCIAVDRRGRTETARVIVHSSPKRQLSVALWAWDGCGRKRRAPAA